LRRERQAEPSRWAAGIPQPRLCQVADQPLVGSGHSVRIAGLDVQHPVGQRAVGLIEYFQEVAAGPVGQWSKEGIG
jgi:hypothetical protein